ncbi:HAMP domain-containing sensor histidine kinase [Chryseobacterium taichungense]|uniref:HAMP domain-containing sensor histidine kinase n=1 Tax=Chryseobacterium taichungense TaxID=295069 RepID=UPI0028AF0597|nr:HAMP domain-containing sensor histidine kinase [Chryseobacterium taichungense]
MKIKYRILIQFTSLISSILIIFSFVIYYFSKSEKETNFLSRIEKRSAIVATLFVNYRFTAATSLLNIYKNSLSRLPEEDIAIYDNNGKLIFTNSKIFVSKIDGDFLSLVKEKGKVHSYKDYYATSGYIYNDRNHRLLIVTSALDLIGKGDNINLLKTLILANCLGVLLTVVAGYFFASRMLNPIKNINNKVKKITTYNEHKRLPVSRNKDEINELAVNFNLMLERLEYSFYQQKDFISHASHELRTPLSSMKTEIQLGLWEDHNCDEYKNILQNLLIDTDRLIDLSSAILLLGKPYDSIYSIESHEINVEDIIHEIQKEYRLNSSRIKIKTNASLSQKIKCNRILFKNLLFNLLDNAMKYSESDVNVNIEYTKTKCVIEVVDKGIGISKDDITRIFNPFFRSDNVHGYKGFGIGLSLCKSIVEFHKGEISVRSIKGETSFTVILPNS